MTQTTHALVTGASAGIGAAFARELAVRGTALVLTARRANRLHALATALRGQYGIDVQVIVRDLADPAAPDFLQREIDRRGLVIGTLANNAGYGVPGGFLSKPWRTHADFIQVLMTAPTELCHRFLPAMRERRAGRIVNVASLVGHVPAAADHTLYGASKAYLIKFSQALALENRGYGVHVCALCPGFTYSEFHEVTGTRERVKRLPRWMWMSAEDVAREGLDAADRGESIHITGRVNRAIKSVIKLLPDKLGAYAAARQGKQFRDAK